MRIQSKDLKGLLRSLDEYDKETLGMGYFEKKKLKKEYLTRFVPVKFPNTGPHTKYGVPRTQHIEPSTMMNMHDINYNIVEKR